MMGPECNSILLLPHVYRCSTVWNMSLFADAIVQRAVPVFIKLVLDLLFALEAAEYVCSTVSCSFHMAVAQSSISFVLCSLLGCAFRVPGEPHVLTWANPVMDSYALWTSFLCTALYFPRSISPILHAVNRIYTISKKQSFHRRCLNTAVLLFFASSGAALHLLATNYRHDLSMTPPLTSGAFMSSRKKTGCHRFYVSQRAPKWLSVNAAFLRTTMNVQARVGDCAVRLPPIRLCVTRRSPWIFSIKSIGGLRAVDGVLRFLSWITTSVPCVGR